MRKIKRWKFTALGVVLAASLPLIDAAQAQTKLIEQAGYPVPDLSNILNLVSEQAGFFKEEGLQVEVRFSTGGPQATQITASGGADVGQVTQEPAIEGYDKGIRGKMFYTQFTRLIYHIAVPADSPIQSIADLKGKKIGVSNMASASLVVARSALRLQGVPIDGDMFRPVGLGDGAVAALRTGQVQALSMWTAAYASMMRAGTPLRFLYHPTVAEIGSGGFFASDNVLREKRDTLIRFGRAQAKATIFLLENPEATLGLYWRSNPAGRGTGTDEEAMRRGLEEMRILRTLYTREKLPDKRYGFADMAGIQTYIDMFRNEGVITRAIPASEVVSNDFVDAINDFDLAQVRAVAHNWR
jgi:NitT/TauT family transport system substrate-binding protein